MKKILLLLVLLLAYKAGPTQSLVLKTKDGKIIPNGGLVYAGGLPDAYMMLELDVQNVSNQSHNVLVKKYIRFEAVDSTATFCWGLCFPWFLTQSPDPITIDAGAVSHDFSADYAPGGVLGHTRLGFTFFVADNPNDSIMVDVEFAPSWFTITDNAGNLLQADQWVNLAGPHTLTMTYDLVIKNNSMENKGVQFKRIEKSLVPGSEMFFCWGACFPSNILQLPEPARMGPGEVTEGVSVDYDPKSHSGTSIATYVVWDVDQPQDSVWLNFAFDGQAAGIITLDGQHLKIFPNPASDKAFLEIPAQISSPSFVRVASLEGQTMKMLPVNPGSLLCIDLHEYSAGVYLVSLISNGCIITTTKLFKK
ncbi:MAG: T9SS type A sorting domain-containing protein [Bacteroidales bacterium]